jgi:hypothetical protein
LAPDLHKRIVRHGLGEGDLFIVREVEVIDAADECLMTFLLAQLGGKFANQRRLSDALHAVYPDEEGPRGAGLQVRLQML